MQFGDTVPDHKLTSTAQNLALDPGVRVAVSVARPTGGGTRNPQVLLNDIAHQLDGHPLADFLGSRCYDTYDGQNHAAGPDWYAVEFTTACTFNWIEMTLGLPYRDGGWWTTLAVEVRAGDEDPWQPATNLTITPSYDFTDGRGERRPFANHVLTFDTVTAIAVRVIGRPGGVAQFTALARLAVYHRDLTHWDPTTVPAAPTPYVFQIIPPAVIWDISENFVRLTGLTVEFPLLEYYLDERRYQQSWARLEQNYRGQPQLWFLVGEAIGWRTWNQLVDVTNLTGIPTEPHVRRWFHDALGCAVSPLVVQGEVIGKMATQSVILKDDFDLAWHRIYAERQGIPWVEYQAAIARTPQMTIDQLEGAAALIGMITNTIVDLTVRNRRLARELDSARQALRERSLQRKHLVSVAVEFMQHNLELPIKIADIAREINLSPSYFGVLFQEETGQTPVDYLIDLRIERAKEYFRHTQMTVTDVCAQLGYDPSYFSRLFKRRTGYAPGDYAQRVRSTRAAGSPPAAA